MNSYWFSFIFSYSLIIAVIIGTIRYNKVDEQYRPFVWLLWVGIINEILSTVLIVYDRSNAVNANVYVLIEALLFVLLFKRWHQLSLSKAIIISTVIISAWIFDNILWHRLTTINSPFRVLASCIMVFLAIEQLNKLLIDEVHGLRRNGKFIIAVGMIFFFSFKSFVELFYAIPVEMTGGFYRSLFAILVIFNCITNILYAIACLYLPTKPAYLLRS